MIPSAAEVAALVAGNHAEPHRVLGPHADPGGVVIRAFRPDVEQVWIYLEGEREAVPMERVHPGGLFEAHVATGSPGETLSPGSYAFELRPPGRPSHRFRDPYAFEPAFGDVDIYLVGEGHDWRLHHHLGAHARELRGVGGTYFAVLAPSARRVSVVADFNQWDGRIHPLRRVGPGIWELFLPGIGEGALYKYEILGADGRLRLKADPFGRSMELRPQTASRVTVTRHAFGDAAWLAERARSSPDERPMSIYEVHLGSWRRSGEQRARLDPAEQRDWRDPAGSWLSYRELGMRLVDYAAELGFTHLELLPVMEHPLDSSWGYQVTGYFAPTSRYGRPDDLRYFVERCHERGLGVILDWVPAHFPRDAFALGRFDGTALYEHLDARQGEHRQWGTNVFNYGRYEVRNFLISSALYWLDEFHIDGLRADAVASMLYLDYGASGSDQWVRNELGGNENLAAARLLRELSDVIHQRYPGIVLVAEESTAWPRVTHGTGDGGLGFDLKWNMGWMHDTLDYFAKDPVHRRYHHNLLTFSLIYAFSERFVLPLSHDEVVHLKKSLLGKMAGDDWQQFANLRALYGYMWAHPGKKLLFMGGELAQRAEWSDGGELDWGLLGASRHQGVQRLVHDLNHAYRRHPALYQLDNRPEGFRWLDPDDALHSVYSFLRFPRAEADGYVVCVANLTPVPRYGYRVGVPWRCRHVEVLNTDAEIYGGGGMGNLGAVEAQAFPWHGLGQSLELTLPPLAVLWLVPEHDR